VREGEKVYESSHNYPEIHMIAQKNWQENGTRFLWALFLFLTAFKLRGALHVLGEQN